MENNFPSCMMYPVFKFQEYCEARNVCLRKDKCFFPTVSDSCPEGYAKCSETGSGGCCKNECLFCNCSLVGGGNSTGNTTCQDGCIVESFSAYSMNCLQELTNRTAETEEAVDISWNNLEVKIYFRI